MFLPAPDEAIWTGVIRLSLEVPGSRSLKDKRGPVHRVRDRLRARRNLSVAEVGHLDHRSRAVLAVAAVSRDPSRLRATLDGVRRDVVAWGGVHLVDAAVEILRVHGDGLTGGWPGPESPGDPAPTS